MATLHCDGVQAVYRLVATLAILLIADGGPAADAAGTSQGSSFLGVVDAYDVRTNHWTSVAGMPLPGRPGAAVAAPDGRIYVFGIEGTTSTFAYTPATDRWTPRAPMPTPRSGFAAALGGDGRIYLIGGKTATYMYVNTVQAYDPRTDAWQAAASMPTARAGLAAATGPDGRVYAMGGLWQNGQFLGDRAFATVEVYTPATNSWATAASMPAPNVGLAATTAPDGRIYAIGGSAGAASVYTPATNQWSSAPALLTAGASAAVTGPDGRIYPLGGAYATGGVGGPHGDTIVSQTHQALDEAYRPGAGQWTAISPLPTSRTQTAAATGSDGRIYAFGGFAVLLAPPGTATAGPGGNCRFVLGFQTLYALIPNVAGDCLDDEQHNPANGDGLQHTTNGLLVWRKADNFTAFTDGYHTWINGPTGLEYRLNMQRFAWEANPDHLPVIPDAHVGATQGEQPAGPRLITTASTLGQDAGPLVFHREGTGFGAGETVTVQGTYTPAFLVATGDPQSPFQREACDPVPLGPVHATADGAGRFSLTLQGNTNLLKGGDLSIIAMGSNGAHITLGGGGSLPEVATLPAGCRA